MRPVSSRSFIAIALLLVVCTVAVELWMGRLVLGPDGRFAIWESDIWSAAMSQRFADPYSISHILHGVLFYAALWLVAPKLPLSTRALAAVLLECAWEVLENSPLIIERYRTVTISLGYEGDSIVNSLGDVVMMAIGFALAARLRVWQSILFVALAELIMLVWLRDNLTLNIIMLVHPIDAIRDWQMAAAPAALPH